MLTADMVWRGCWICTDRFQTDNCLYLCSPPGSYRTYYWVWSLNSRLNELTVVSRGCWRPVWSGVQAWFFFPPLLLLLLAPSSPLLSLLYFSSPSSSSFPFPLYCCLSYLLFLSFPLLLFPPFSFCTDSLFLLPALLCDRFALTLTSSFPSLLCDRLFLGKGDQMLAHPRQGTKGRVKYRYHQSST